ncbi:MAG: thiamine pyrophosphate-dependent enzyme [Pseudomonadales bacterium]
MSDANQLHEKLRRRMQTADYAVGNVGRAGLPNAAAVGIFRAQCMSRHLDRIARNLQKNGKSFYTIGSSGHENMATVAESLRDDDMAFLHYRDAAFQIRRAMRVPGSTPLRDMLLSFTCSSEDPLSGGRHKVLGSRSLAIPPQTSTIASHLPKAVGAAYSIGMPRGVNRGLHPLRRDSIVACTFGDASANHSTAQGALNTAAWMGYRGLRLPILFVCEDNGIGISVPTPEGWIASSFQHRPGLRYFYADGLNAYDSYAVAREAVEHVREQRQPAFLHLSMVRLLGHAGSDPEISYRSSEDIASDEHHDPILHTARLIADREILDGSALLAIYDQVGAQCEAIAAQAAVRPHLASATDVMRSIVPPRRAVAPASIVTPDERREAFGREWNNIQQPQPMAKLLNWGLLDLLLEHQELFLVGQDIGKKGGVYGVTQRLQQQFRAGRVMDSLLDEQSILGLAIGAAHNGFLPIPEIQFLAYIHNAEDQLRGEAATLSFFSNGQFTNPMVVRVAGLAYQRGFGGHFHNDNSLGVLRDIPGLIVACPSSGRDAVAMLRESVRLAREEQRIVVFLEPIALYNTRDLHEKGDNAWSSTYPEATYTAPFGEVAKRGNGPLAIVSYGNGYYLANQASRTLEREYGIETCLIDLRWLAPLPVDSLIKAIGSSDHVLVVDECRRSGNVSEAIMACLHEAGLQRIARLTAEDSFIPTGPAYAATLPSCAAIVETSLALLGIES